MSLNVIKRVVKLMSCCQIEIDGITFQKKTHLLSPSDRLTVISKNYLVLSILFVNMKVIHWFMLILTASTNHRVREPPAHNTVVCPTCGTIFFERDVFKIHVSNGSPKKWPMAHTQIFFPQMLIYQYSEEDDHQIRSHSLKVFAPRVIPLKPIAVMKKCHTKKHNI